MKTLLESWKKYIKESTIPWNQQKFEDARGSWVIGDLLEYIKENGIMPQPFSVEELAENNLKPEEGTKTSDASPEDFEARAHSSDLQYKIIVVEYPDGLWIADGVHRTWKARNNKQEQIMGYLLDWEEDLLNIPHGEPSEESKGSPY
jgi:hypothetical protein